MITKQQSAILKYWEIEAVAQCETLQENVFHLTLEDGRHFVFKAIGPDQPSIIERLHFEYDNLYRKSTFQTEYCRLTGEIVPVVKYSTTRRSKI